MLEYKKPTIYRISNEIYYVSDINFMGCILRY